MGEIKAIAYSNGHKILYINNQWVFEDTREPIHERKCKKCGEEPVNGHDHCIANLPNVKHACCGHGIQEPYIVLNTGEYIKFVNKEQLYKYFESESKDKIMKNKNKAIVVQSDTDIYEGLYVNGELRDEGDTLNEGKERVLYFVELSKTYDFNLDEIEFKTLSEKDDNTLMKVGNLPKHLNELSFE